MEETDEDLMQRFARKGDRDALAGLFTRHAPEAYRTARLILRDPGASEDAVQEAFSRLLTRASAYDPARPFLPWLRSLVAHAALDRSRAERRRAEREKTFPAERTAEDPSMRLIDAETRARLREEIDRLPEELRLPVALHYQAGYSYSETAEALGYPEGTVATRLAAARERLKTALAGLLLTAGISLEEAAAASAPAVEPVPPTLSAALAALAASASLPAVPSAALVPAKPLALAALGLLVLGTGFLGWKAARQPEPARVPGVLTPPPPPPPVRTAPASSAPSGPEAPAMPAAPLEEFVPDAVGEAGVATLRVRVTCRETGLPIPGAEVRAVARFPEVERPVPMQTMARSGEACETDARGEARVEVPAGVPYRLEVSAPGFSLFATGLESMQPSEVDDWDLSSGLWRETTEAPLKAGETLDRAVALSRGWGILLRLLDADGRPLKAPLCTCRIQGRKRGYAFHARDPRAGGDEYLTFSRGPSFGGDGVLEIGGLDPEAFPVHEARLTVEAMDCLPTEAPPLYALPFQDGRIRLDLRMDAGLPLRGRALLPDGRPAAGARIWIEDGPGAEAGPDGAFAFQGLPRGRALRLRACAEGACLDAPLELPGAGRTDLEIRLAAGETVAGKVLDADGRPVAGIRVQVRAEGLVRPCSTNAYGEFSLSGFPRPARLEVFCVHPDWDFRTEGWTGVPAGTRGLEIRLSRLQGPGKPDTGDFLRPWPAP